MLVVLCGVSLVEVLEVFQVLQVFGVHRLPGSSLLVLWPVVASLFVGGLLVGVGLVVCVTSCEGHVVDALASRADEGRRSLR